MDEKQIERIVRKVFEKAKKEHASHSRFALSNHVSYHSDLSSKTLERAYDRYINKKKKYGAPQAESVELFCKYLGFEDYADYVKKNPLDEPEEGARRKKWIKITVLIAFGMVLIIIGILKWPTGNPIEKNPTSKCMAWADTLYVEVSCATKPYSKYGTSVEPLDKMKLENFKKVEVDMSTQFFAEKTNKPLIWYYKNKNGEIEYYTAPGLHPINGETLRKITPYIIQTYVPVHRYKKESFMQQ